MTTTNTRPFTNERTGRTEWVTDPQARTRPELRRQSHKAAGSARTS